MHTESHSPSKAYTVSQRTLAGEVKSLKGETEDQAGSLGIVVIEPLSPAAHMSILPVFSAPDRKDHIGREGKKCHLF